jgi:hypothetical protein
MNTKSKTEFSSYTPEQLVELYKRDPEHFEEIASEAISQACIGKTPEQTLRQRQLQWTIDAQLRKAKTPLERMQVMENIFYSRVFGANGELAQLADSCKELIHAVSGTEGGAEGGTEVGIEETPIRKPALYLVKK